MKSNTPLILGVAGDYPNRLQTDRFLFENYTLTTPLEFRRRYTGVRDILITEVPVKILTMSAKRVINRVMSGDIAIGIATLDDVIRLFGEFGKIPMNEGAQFGYFDKKYQGEFRAVKRTGGDDFDEANRFSYVDTGEKGVITGRSVPLYELAFSLEDGIQREGDIPVGVVSLRNLRKIPELRTIITDISERADSLYRNSQAYKERYPRG